MKCSIPGKVIILGEYAVLANRPALVGTISPRFYASDDGGAPFVAQEKSPLGRLKHWATKQGWPDVKINFSDPYQGAGGFGASSAEFAVGYYFYSQAANISCNWNSAFALYRELMKSDAQTPSGADLVAQWGGGVGVFNPGESDYESIWASFDWENLLVFSATTNQPSRKIATHLHLEKLKERGFSPEDPRFLIEIEKPLFRGINAARERNSALLGQAMVEYADILNSYGLEIETTTQDRAVFQNMSGVLGAKGTGAMQADALLVLVDPLRVDRKNLIATAADRNLILISDGLKREAGITCQS